MNGDKIYSVCNCISTARNNDYFQPNLGYIFPQLTLAEPSPLRCCSWCLTEPTDGKLLLSPSRGTGDDGLLDPGVLLPKPGHLQNEQPNKVVHKGLSKEDHGAGRRWQEASWMVFWEMRAAVN